MQPFHYDGGALFCEGASLSDIAEQAGTPCYVYSATAILDRYRDYDQAFDGFPHQICYAVKANSNLSVLKLLADAGSGFDIVSGGELYRVLRAGGDPARVIYSGVGKKADEIEYCLRERIHSFNCESEPELLLLDTLAGRQRVKARIAIRINPDVDASTHPYISTGLREHKFGIDVSEAEHLYQRASACPNLLVEGVSCHIGSQLLDTTPLLEAVDATLALIDRLRALGIPIETLDLGGGLGVAYRPGDESPSIAALVQEVCRKASGKNLKLYIEPGRSITGEAGALLTRVLYRKANGGKEFIIVDAGMNDLIRPALYHSHHEIVPVRQSDGAGIKADIVGPVCESGDFLARDRAIPEAEAGDLLAVCTAGAYGFVSASNYNSRPRAPEVLVKGSEWQVVRQRESYEDLVRGES